MTYFYNCIFLLWSYVSISPESYILNFFLFTLSVSHNPFKHTSFLGTNKMVGTTCRCSHLTKAYFCVWIRWERCSKFHYAACMLSVYLNRHHFCLEVSLCGLRTTCKIHAHDDHVAWMCNMAERAFSYHVSSFSRRSFISAQKWAEPVELRPLNDEHRRFAQLSLKISGKQGTRTW